MSDNNFIKISKNCDGILIPSGDQIKLKKGTPVKITQSLGGYFTLYVNGNLVKLDGRDGDAIGQKIDKKVGKEIQKTFSIKNFDVKKTINQDFEDYLSNRLLSIYSNNDVIGYAYIGTAPSQTKYFDYLVLFDKEIVIKSIKILIYREDYGGEIGSKRWLKQFIGKSLYDKFVYRENIAAISGATISVNSITDAINELIIYLNTLKREHLL